MPNKFYEIIIICLVMVLARFTLWLNNIDIFRINWFLKCFSRCLFSWAIYEWFHGNHLHHLSHSFIHVCAHLLSFISHLFIHPSCHLCINRFIFQSRASIVIFFNLSSMINWLINWFIHPFIFLSISSFFIFFMFIFPNILSCIHSFIDSFALHSFFDASFRFLSISSFFFSFINHQLVHPFLFRFIRSSFIFRTNNLAIHSSVSSHSFIYLFIRSSFILRTNHPIHPFIYSITY